MVFRLLLKEIINKWTIPRSFEEEGKISREGILKLIEAARWAPSAENQQVWRFLVVENKEKKGLITEAIKRQDPRLKSTKHEIEKPVLDAKFVFNTNNFNALKDKYKDLIQNSHKNDINCSKEAAILIIFTHSQKFLGNTFGSTDIGAAMSNVNIEAYNLGYNCRWIRNFDREFLQEQFSISDKYSIDSIFAIGKEKLIQDHSEVEKKDFKNFFFINQWEKGPDFSKFQEEESFKEYDVSAIDAILDRRSVRDFQEDKKIPLYHQHELMNAAMMVPLTVNEPYIKILLIDDRDIIGQIAENSKIVIRRQKHVQQVPLIIIPTYDCTNNSPAFYAEEDTGAIIQNMLLRAHSFGIGSCWIGAFNRDVVKEIINIPEQWHIPTLAIFGYPNEYPPAPPRKDLGKICFYDDWKNRIKERERTFMPSSHFLSILFRRMKNGENKSILRERRVGEIEEISEFKEFLKE
jgi:nitroreductase